MIEGENLEVCIIIIRGTVTFSFEVRVYLVTPSKLYLILNWNKRMQNSLIYMCYVHNHSLYSVLHSSVNSN